jgi:cysteine synthase A
MRDDEAFERRNLLKGLRGADRPDEGAKGMQGRDRQGKRAASGNPDSFVPGSLTTGHSGGPQGRHGARNLGRLRREGRSFRGRCRSGRGTLTGAGRIFKIQKPMLHIVAVEPDASPMLSEGRSARMACRGSARTRPRGADTKIYDDNLPRKKKRTPIERRELTRTEGLLVGISPARPSLPRPSLPKDRRTKARSSSSSLPIYRRTPPLHAALFRMIRSGIPR